MKFDISSLHHNPSLGKVFHTLNYCLQTELANCSTVLDIGCGPSSPIQYCKHLTYTVGVEAFPPYVEKAQKLKTHTKIINKNIQDLKFESKSFDAVVLIEVIEHLPKEVVQELIHKAEKWAKKKIIITSPNGFIPQTEIDGNPMQKHLSGWDLKTMKSLGFTCKGLAGLKFLRDNAEKDTMNDDLTASIRFKPRKLWFLIAALSQIITYYTPSIAFELFSIRKIVNS